MLVQTAMVIPLSLGGWGPRDGIAAWAFAATGLGAATGTSVATAYGVLATIATLPGAALLLVRHQKEPVEELQHEAVAVHA
jgi:hypothetical protein